MSFRTLYCDDEDVDFVKDIRDDIELPMPTFTTGIAFGYQLNDRFELETGAYYAKKGFHTEKLNYSTVEDPEGSGSYARILYSYSYLDVPVTLNSFFFTQSRLQLVTSVSLTTSFLLQADEYYRFYGNEDQNTIDLTSTAHYQPVALSAEAGLGISWQLADHFQLRALPTFRYGLTRINKDPITARLWSGGVMVGVHYLF